MTSYDYVCLASSCSHLKLDIPVLYQKIQRFDSKEIQIDINKPIQNSRVLFLTSMAGHSRSPSDYIVETLITLSLLRPARHVTLGILYGAYTRQADKGQWMYNLFAQACDDVWILDPHGIPPESVHIRSACTLFAQDISQRFTDPPLIVSPDQGGAERARHVARILGADVCVLSKKRSHDGVEIEEGAGGIVKGRTCVVVDDIIDSGKTLLAASAYLSENKACDMHAYATHGLMSAETFAKLNAHYASVRLTDSVYHYFFDEPLARSSLLPLDQSQLGVR